MQYIDSGLPNIIEARDNHYKYLRYIIKKKLNGPAFSEEPPVFGMDRIRKVNIVSNRIADFINDEDNLKTILIGTPQELDTIKHRFSSATTKPFLKDLINYDKWIDKGLGTTYKFYNAYDLAIKLDIPTCIYCNRIYTKTVEVSASKKITRPTFDHWFPKSKYPLLALSFYNLIPSCSVCNTGVKGTSEFTLATHFHPYYRNSAVDFEYTFSYDHKDYDKFTFKIKSKNEFSKRSVEAFQLEDIFKAHEDEIEDLRKIKYAYSDKYIDILERDILGRSVSLSREDVYRLAFGVHFQEANFDRRPLSKMKKDILKELGII